ncbi:MAG: hypothetical protein ONB05_11095, partial [candidate division KSB1 bacterium]|nr:hypothetical protein [candidate division KSB1 bacterium]
IMREKFFSLSQIGCGLVVGFSIMVTCINPFAPGLEKSPEFALLITEQRTPEEVLQNFKLAYIFKDSLLYSELLDSSFVFVYFDPNVETSGRFVSWGRDVDLQTTGRLFRNCEVINLVWESTVYIDTTKVDTIYVNRSDFKLEPVSIELIKRFSLKLVGLGARFDYDIWGKAVFSFIKNPHDKKWRISRWTDESGY